MIPLSPSFRLLHSRFIQLWYQICVTIRSVAIYAFFPQVLFLCFFVSRCVSSNAEISQLVIGAQDPTVVNLDFPLRKNRSGLVIQAEDGDARGQNP